MKVCFYVYMCIYSMCVMGAVTCFLRMSYRSPYVQSSVLSLVHSKSIKLDSNSDYKKQNVCICMPVSYFLLQILTIVSYSVSFFI